MNGLHESFQTLFLSELSSLDAFTVRREADGALPIASDDPDVRRILEAMAYFSARTRAVAAERTAAAVCRLAAGTLDDLLVVQPAAMMVECVAGEEIGERHTVPRNTLLRGASADGRVGLFATLQPVTLNPLSIEKTHLFERCGHLYLRLQLRSRQPQKTPLSVSLYVRRLDDYRASLALHDAMERHLVRAFVRPEGGGSDLRCHVRFGSSAAHASDHVDAGPVAGEDLADPRGALAQLRSFFHLPEQDLFVQVDLPTVALARTSIDVFFELDGSFPRNLSVSNDTFRLHVVPVHNAWVDLAEPVLWDGTKASAPVRNARPLLDAVEPGMVSAVYRSTDHGLAPVLPAALARGGDTYEVHVEPEAGETRLLLSIEGAFERPCKLFPEVHWSQPSLWSAPPGRLSMAFQTRHLPGVTLRQVGPLRAPRQSLLARDPARCLDVLSLRMRPAVERRDLTGMLEILGAGDEGLFRGFASLVDELDSVEKPDPERRAGGIRRVYHLGLRQRAIEDAPMVRRLAAKVEQLLKAWTEDPVAVETTTRLVASLLSQSTLGAQR